MFVRLLFYLILYPISILPLMVVYLLFLPFFVITNFILRYRHNVATKNLKQSFPDMSMRQIRKLRTANYYHLTLVAAEMLKMLTISRKNVIKRYHCVNPEVVDKFYNEGRSVILMSSHYNNWEWMVLSIDMQFKHHGIGIGAHNSDKVFEKIINRARTRYGDEIAFADNIREIMEENEKNHKPCAYMFLSDQCPSNPQRCYVTDFLNHKTGFIRGAEGFAKKYDIPVLYYEVIKDRIGYYHFEVKVLSEHPSDLPDGTIMQKYAECLEETIKRKPEHWLWTHRRWKHNFE